MTSAQSALRNGNGGDEQNSSPRTSGVTSVSKAIAVRGDDSRTPTTVVENYFEEREIRKECAVILGAFTARQLEKASGCSTDAAKLWIAGRRIPNLTSAFNIAQSLPTVRDWVALRCGMERVMQARSWDVWLQGLYTIAGGSGLDAERARWAIARLTNEVTTETILKDSLALHDRREAVVVAVEKEKSGTPPSKRRRA